LSNRLLGHVCTEAAKKKTKRTPRYTVLDLLHELDRYAPIALFLFGNGRCVEIDLELLMSLQRKENGAGIADTSVYVLSVPRQWFGVLTPNPGYRRRQVGGK
jgi:hypothetical protein